MVSMHGAVHVAAWQAVCSQTTSVSTVGHLHLCHGYGPIGANHSLDSRRMCAIVQPIPGRTVPAFVPARVIIDRVQDRPSRGSEVQCA